MTDDPASPKDRAASASQPPRRRGEWRTLPEWQHFVWEPTLFAPMSEAEMADEGWL